MQVCTGGHKINLDNPKMFRVYLYVPSKPYLVPFPIMGTQKAFKEDLETFRLYFGVY